MKAPDAPFSDAAVFDVSVIHHRFARGAFNAADHGLPAGFELAVRGAFHLADTLEFRLVGAPAGEAPLRIRRLRVQAMTHAGDLLVGGWAMAASAGPTSLDVLRTRLVPLFVPLLAPLLGPLAEGVHEARVAGEITAGRDAAGPQATTRDSIYPLAREAAQAAQPWLPWLLPEGTGAVRRLRLLPGPLAAAAERSPGTRVDPFWARVLGGSAVAAEAEVALQRVSLSASLEAPRSLLAARPRARALPRIAAVA